ncbi:MAG TPA: phage tail protein [Fimbriimonadaceae bacterium]|nr:phage tail protein [Fimbriimonadaceae bacterium]
MGIATHESQLDNSKRGYVAGHYALELDGKLAGWLMKVSGGQASAGVVDEKLGADHIVHKHIGNVKYDEITFNCGTGMSRDMYEWIKAEFDGKYVRRSGAIVQADYNFKQLTRLDFQNALISEVGFPACDASSKDAAKMTIKVSPEVTRLQKGSGNLSGPPTNPQMQKRWLPANFRLTIDGIDCTRVSKIDAITVKQKVVEAGTGQIRDYEKEPAHLEVPNLVISIPESHAQAFYQWHEDFVVKGNNGQNGEKHGELTFLAPDMRTELFTLNFQHIGIFKIGPDKSVPGAENIRRVKVEMYCEDIKFDYKSSAWAARAGKPVHRA